MSQNPRTVGDAATLVRSKNAGPFWMTFDIFCATDAEYNAVAQLHVVTPDRIAALYRVDPAMVKIFRIPTLRVIKVSVPRPAAQGGVHDRDMHSGQQHVPLMRLSLDPTV